MRPLLWVAGGLYLVALAVGGFADVRQPHATPQASPR